MEVMSRRAETYPPRTVPGGRRGVPVAAVTRYFVGLDLGQAQDFTALAVLSRPRLTGN
jgi:hypothetical protein